MLNSKIRINKIFVSLVVIASILFPISCATRTELKSDAEKNRKIAEEYRKEEYGDLGIYYSDRFNERADKADSRAARMVADEPSLNFIIKGIYGLFFKKKDDR